MEITLKHLVTEEVNGEKKVSVKEKTYTLPHAPMGAYLDYLSVNEKIGDENLTKETIKQYAELIARTYKGQFTAEEFLDGLPFAEVTPSISKFIEDLTRDHYADLKPEGNGKKEKK